MSTDAVLAAIELVLAVSSAAVATWLLIQIRRNPDGVRMMRRPVPHPKLLAAAYVCFTIGLGANAVHDLVGRSPALNALSLAGMGGALVFIIVGAARRPV